MDLYEQLKPQLTVCPKQLTLDFIEMSNCFVWINRETIILVCPTYPLTVKPKDKKRLVHHFSDFDVLPGIHEADFFVKPTICCIKLDDHRLLVGWDKELFLRCVNVDITRPPEKRWRKKRKFTAEPAIFTQFETFYLGPFTPAKWMVRLQHNLFFALSHDFESFFFQLSAEESSYRIVSFYELHSFLPITSIEVLYDGAGKGAWKVEHESLLFSQGSKVNRSLLTLKQDCIEASEVDLYRMPIDDIYHSLWMLGENTLIVKGTQTTKYIKLENRWVEMEPSWSNLLKNTLYAGDNKVITRKTLVMLDARDVITFELPGAFIWGKVCQGFVVSVSLDYEYCCYDENLVLIHREKLAQSDIFFQAEKNSTDICFIAARYDNVIELRLFNLESAQTRYEEITFEKTPCSGVIKQMDSGFFICLGGEKGFLTLFTFGAASPAASENLLVTGEDLLIMDLPSNDKNVKAPSEVWIAIIDLRTKVCKLCICPSLRRARAVVPTASGLIVLDEEFRLKSVPFKGRHNSIRAFGSQRSGCVFSHHSERLSPPHGGDYLSYASKTGEYAAA